MVKLLITLWMVYQYIQLPESKETDQGFHHEDNGDFKGNRTENRPNPRGKPASVCFPTDTGRQMYLSAGQ
jgi:hypothetical protein